MRNQGAVCPGIPQLLCLLIASYPASCRADHGSRRPSPAAETQLITVLLES
jgi:hypothetical protein